MRIWLGKGLLALSAAVLLALAFAGLAEGEIAVNEANFPDAQFRSFILENIDEDGVLTEDEIYWIRDLDVTDRGIKSLKGIGYFTELEYLYCGNNPLTALDLSANTKLRDVDCSVCSIKSINVTACADLERLEAGHNQLTALDVSGNPALRELYCYHNQLKALNASANTALAVLLCDNNAISTLTLPDTEALQELLCYSNPLKTLDVTHNPGLVNLNCGYCELSKLDVTQNPALTDLDCCCNQLTRLNVTRNPELHLLICYNNQLTELDVTHNDLWTLSCGGNRLTALDVTHSGALDRLACYENQLTELDISQCPSLYELYCYTNQLTELDVSQNRMLIELDCTANSLTTLDVSNALEIAKFVNDDNYHDLEWCHIYGTLKERDGTMMLDRGVCVDPSVEVIANNFDAVRIDDYFDDEAFRNYIRDNIDDGDGWLSSDEIMNTHELHLGDLGIENLWGIEIFTQVEVLYCYHNQLTGVNVSNMLGLREFNCCENQITDLYLARNTALETLLCYNNQLTELDLSGNPELSYLECFFNNLERLNVTECPKLETLWCSDNRLTELNLYSNPALNFLFCTGNEMYGLDLCNCPELTKYVNGDYYYDREYVLYYGEVDIVSDEEWNLIHGVVCDPYTQLWGGDAIEVVYVNENCFPDDNFRAFIASEEVDWDQNGILCSGEFSRDELSATDLGIESLQGIHYFWNLKVLNCENNALSELDVSRNENLEILFCPSNRLTGLDLSANPALVSLECWNNDIEWLDVTQCQNLKDLWCMDNHLTELDLSGNPALRTLLCTGNDMWNLDVSDCPELTACVNIDYYADVSYQLIYGEFDEDWDDPDNHNHGIICDPYTQIHGGEPVEVVYVNEDCFPDDNFRAFIASKEVDWDENGILCSDEFSRDDLFATDLGIESLQGIHYFWNLKDLHCENNALSELDVSRNEYLEILFCHSNRLTGLDLSANPALVSLECWNNDIEWLNVTQCQNLNELWCMDNRLTELDLSGNPALRTLLCTSNDLWNLDVSDCPKLTACVNGDYYTDEGYQLIYGEFDEDWDHPDNHNHGIICDPYTWLHGGEQLEAFNIVRLPEAVSIVDDEAFESIAADVVFVNGGCGQLGDRAFAGSERLKRAYIPGGVEISDSAFDGCDNLTICSTDGAIRQWAENHGFHWANED